MLNKEQLETLLSKCLDSDADFAEIFEEDTTSQSIQMLNGLVEEINQNNRSGIGVRIYKDCQTVYGYTNDLEMESLLAFVSSLKEAFGNIEKQIPIQLNEEIIENKHPVLIHPIEADLKDKIDRKEYKEGTFLPPENTLVQQYDCSRNTIRRAISHLVMEGYVQPRHGKGVRVIQTAPQPQQKYDFRAMGMEGLTTTVTKYGYHVRTKVITFTELIVDEKLSQKTDFPVGTEVYFIQRVRYLDDIAKMVDTNLLRKDIIKDLTKEIAQKSLFEYYTKVLGIELTTIKRTVTVERATPFDEHYLTLGDYNCMAVMTSKCYNQYGIQFEYSESRNRPDLFSFHSVISKSMQPNL